MEVIYLGRAPALSVIRLVSAGILVLLMGRSVLAQSMQQSFELKAGWNAVYVEVDPDPSNLDDLFAGTEVRSVWVRDDSVNGKSGQACADGTDCVPSTETGWRVWFPPDTPQRVISSLRTLRGGRVVLIDSALAQTWSIRGKPDSAVTRWRAGFDLNGFHVVDQADQTPSFGSYLEASPAHEDTVVFRVDPDGSFSRVEDVDSTKIVPGQGYWVKTARNTIYDGPIRIDDQSLRGAEFQPGTAEHFIEIENLSGSGQSVTLTDTVESNSSGSDTAVSPVKVPLKWYDFADGSAPKWQTLDNVTVALKSRGTPGSVSTIRIGVDRTTLATGAGAEDRTYDGLLKVTDDSGYCRWIPVKARGGDPDGLWVGDVTVNQVLSLTGEDTEPTPTASDFVFRIIIHKRPAEFRLLREAVLVYREAQGDYVLVTPSCFGLLEGRGPLPRVSSDNFAFDGDLLMTGDFASSLQATISMAATDSLNPFVHPFNPIHTEGFAVTRTITLQFDADGGGDPEWGISRLAGTYGETVMGLHRNVIEAKGRFELRRVSSIATLCGS